MSYTIEGGSNTNKERTINLTLSTETNINTVNIPILLADSNSIKSVTITVTVDGDKEHSVTKTLEYDNTARNERTISVSVGLTGQTSISIQCSCKNATINYGTYTYPFVLGDGVAVASGAYNMILSVSAVKVWAISGKNNGYPLQIDNSLDASLFEGYTEPKPFNSWKLDSNNAGYPWTWGFAEISDENNIFLKTADGLVLLMAYYKSTGGLVPLTFIKQM